MHCAFCAYLCAIRAALGVASFRSRRFSSSASRSSRQPLCQLHQIVSLGFSWFWLRMSTMKACQTSSLAIVSVLATLFINIWQHRQEPEMCRHPPIGFPLLRCTFICSCTSRACCFNLVPTLKGILKWVLAFISVELNEIIQCVQCHFFGINSTYLLGRLPEKKNGTPMLQATNTTQHNTTIISAPVVGFWKVIKEVALLAPWRANFTSHGTPKVYICTRQTLKLRPGPTMYIVIQLMYIVFFADSGQTVYWAHMVQIRFTTFFCIHTWILYQAVSDVRIKTPLLPWASHDSRAKARSLQAECHACTKS